MLTCAFSAAILGIDGYVVRVEADATPGTPSFAIIGLPERAVGETRERVRAAIHNSGFAIPSGRLLVNLSPADVLLSIKYSVRHRIKIQFGAFKYTTGVNPFARGQFSQMPEFA